MDTTPDDVSDIQTNMDTKSKMTDFQSMDKATQPPQKETEIQRREYDQEQSASSTRRDGESPQSLLPRQIGPSDKEPGHDFDNESQEKMVNVSASQSHKWSLDDLEIFQHPMCMISALSVTNDIGEETKILLKSEDKVFDQIKKIDLPMVVVAIAGLYRTGKSYLMNRLADTSKGFALGNTIESMTKGIWAWCKIHPTMPNTVLLLLDTEGLGDVEKGDQSHDNKIFTLATLLCNCLVYNMKGAFDNDAVSKLTFVTEMASNIRFRGQSSDDNQSINLILPDFVLCLRDFSLKLIKDGKKITENEYLDLSLAEKKSKADQFNKPRACIKKYFTRRECFAFPVPGDGDVLENLETLSFTHLSTRFKEVTTRFTSYIYKIPPKELLASKPINGQMFVTLADRYVTAIKHGAIPDVDDAFTAVAKIENAKVEKEALDIFKNEMEKVMLPVSESDLGKRYTDAQKKALDYLRKNAVLDTQAKCQIHAQRKMDAIWEQIRSTNEQKVRDKCENTLSNLFGKYLEKNLENRVYETAGGHQIYKSDVKRTKDEYFNVLRDFKENEILPAWYGYVESMTTPEAKIIEADKNMSQIEKEAEQRRNQEKLDRLWKQQEKAQEYAFEKQIKDLKDHYEKLDQDRRKQQAAEKEKYEALVKEKLEKEAAQKEAERYKLEQEAADKEAKRYRKEQDDAREEAERLRKEKEERKQEWVWTRVWKAFWNI
ncbi:guanylate-binding protein 2-like [Ruditapes philippinarum]|uniref:guanylate-binding protein 2-like n=1 Tax=Ruditapes philippinarum TaxID=129788 RepID=UPI00295AD110|nr:guanylate-binding protein 2-like [Ruditapes philippinarum]